MLLSYLDVEDKTTNIAHQDLTIPLVTLHPLAVIIVFNETSINSALASGARYGLIKCTGFFKGIDYLTFPLMFGRSVC